MDPSLLWGWMVTLFLDPRFQSAAISFATSMLIDGNLKKAGTCALFAWAATPLVIWKFDIPPAGGTGVGLIIAVIGVHGIVDKARAAHIKTLIEAIKRSRK